MSSYHEPVSLLKAYLEPANNSAWPELPPKYFLFIHFIANIVLALLDKENFQALVKFMLYDLHGLELPQLQTMKNPCDEGRILIILESVEWVLYSSFQLTYLPLSVELELLLSFSLYLLCQMPLSLLNLLLSFFFLRFLN